MKSFVRSAALMSLPAILVVCGEHELAAKADPCRPFKSKGTAEILGDPFLGNAPFTNEGTGTHLGRFTGDGFVTFSPPDEEGIIVGSGSLVYVAANGDELNTTFVGTLDASTGLGTATFTFDGGTGRFADATGEFIASITATGPLTFSFTTTGTICY